MKKILILSLLIIGSCTNKNKIEIKLDKEFYLPGETITARIYVKHDNSTLPDFRIITDYDTTRIPTDENDNECGVYKARFKSTGTKKVSGFVIFTNEQNKIDTINYHFEFIVETIPTIPDIK